MAGLAITFTLIAVGVFLLGLLLGSRHGQAGERQLAEARETGLRGQLALANAEIDSLRPKAEELTRVREQLRNEEAKYEQMKADLGTAFKGAAADALRANTESFLDIARQKLGAQTQEAKQTLAQKEEAIKNLLLSTVYLQLHDLHVHSLIKLCGRIVECQMTIDANPHAYDIHVVRSQILGIGSGARFRRITGCNQ